MSFPALLADLALKTTVLFGAAWLAQWALRRNSASARHFLWIAVFAAALALPLLLWVGPRWNISLERPSAPAVAALPAGTQASGIAVQETVLARRETRRSGLPSWPLILWMAGAVAVLARLAIGHWRVQALAWSSEEIEDRTWRALAAETAHAIGLRRRVALRICRAADVPITCGIWRTVVLLPAAADTWSEERRRVVLLHELFHARRLDVLWSSLAQLALAAHWFHPLAWIAAARFRREQERSCDDAVVRAGTGGAAYAEHLVAVARSIVLPGLRWPGAAVRMAERHDLETRVEALLEPGRRHVESARFRLAAVAGMALLLLPLAAIHAQPSGPTASIAGSVYDASGAAIPNALVLLQNADGKNEEITRADAAGAYRFKAVPAGNYTIKVKAPGFAPYEKSGVELGPAAAASLDVTVALGSVSEAMEVVGTKAAAPRTAPAAAGAPKRIRVGGNVQATKLLHKVNPAYPPDAQAAGAEGTVLLRAVISTQGNLLNVTVVNKDVDAGLAKAAKDAVEQWRYQPTLLNGQPVEVVTTIAITFRLS
jgi:TonB family protein